MLSVSSLIVHLPASRAALRYAGAGSLFILIFHGPIQRQALFLLGRVSPLGVCNGVIAMFFAIIVSLILLELTRRNTILTALLCPRKGPQ
jgi:fucose 4-O-acetylase-like acetyltransferase